MFVLIALACLIVGCLSGFIFTQFLTNQKLAKTQSEIRELTGKLSVSETLQTQIEKNSHEIRADRDRLQIVSDSQQNMISELKVKIGALESENKLLTQQLKAQHDFLDDTRKQTKIEFENLANQILKSNAKDLSEKSEKTLETILKPLQEKLGIFEKKVTDTYTAEANERFALKSEVMRLAGLSDGMTQGTKALTQALLGNSKMQGDWGELVLERILEEAGLTEGREYYAQKEHESDDGTRMRPDFRINLPGEKHIIVDSKVSLTAYELYCRSENEDAQNSALVAHLKSIHKHIDELHDKHYSKLKGVRSPEFVFAFIPIEPAYILAMKSDSALWEKAWRKGVALVPPVTLLTNLKTVESMWRFENQNRNGREIVEEAAKLYDKFYGFLEDFLKIGKAFETGHGHYLNAFGKLKEGSGNILRKMDTIRMLGAAPKHRIKQELLDSADSDDITTNVVTEETKLLLNAQQNSKSE